MTAATSPPTLLPTMRVARDPSAAPSICVVAPLTSLSGNKNTAHRVASFLHGCVVIDTDPHHHHIASVGSDTRRQECYDMCIFVHALRGGRAVFPHLFAPNLFDSSPSSNDERSVSPCQPVAKARSYILVFGGTDINEFAQEAEKRAQMEAVLHRVDAIVCFSNGLRDAALAKWPSASAILLSPTKTWVIPQSVLLEPSSLSVAFDEDLFVRQLLRDAAEYSKKAFVVPSSPAPLVAVLPAGLRSVKDPMFAARAWALLQQDDNRRNSDAHHRRPVILLIAGPPLEESVTRELGEAVRHAASNTFLHPGIPHEALMHWMLAAGSKRRKEAAQLLCVLNTSRSEGQSQTLLEAMWAGVPVVARCIPANEELLHGADSRRGFLVDTPLELAEAVSRLRQCCGGHSADDLTGNEVFRYAAAAREHCREHHSRAQEAAQYQALVLSLLTSTAEN